MEEAAPPSGAARTGPVPAVPSSAAAPFVLKRRDISLALKNRAIFIHKNASDVQDIFAETDILHFIPNTAKRPKKIKAFSTREVCARGFKHKWNLRLKKHLLTMSEFYKQGSNFHDPIHARYLACLAVGLPGRLSSIPGSGHSKNVVRIHSFFFHISVT